MKKMCIYLICLLQIGSTPIKCSDEESDDDIEIELPAEEDNGDAPVPPSAKNDDPIAGFIIKKGIDSGLSLGVNVLAHQINREINSWRRTPERKKYDIAQAELAEAQKEEQRNKVIYEKITRNITLKTAVKKDLCENVKMYSEAGAGAIDRYHKISEDKERVNKLITQKETEQAKHAPNTPQYNILAIEISKLKNRRANYDNQLEDLDPINTDLGNDLIASFRNLAPDKINEMVAELENEYEAEVRKYEPAHNVSSEQSHVPVPEHAAQLTQPTPLPS